MSLLELLIRIPISFLVILCLVRLLGRQEISQMNFFNFVSAITMGAISANLVFNKHLPVIHGIIALAGWSIFTFGMEFADIKSKRARQLIEGEPVILIKGGKIMEHALNKTRLDVNALNALLREKGIFSLEEVNFAVFETDGNLSVLKKEKPKRIHSSLTAPATEVISNGEINKTNVGKLNLSSEGFHQILIRNGVRRLSEVFYAEIDERGRLYVDYMNDQEAPAGKKK
ncbi:DUF421 domain-containing protein [Peribacillus kribbensis]|uniref:DUF421 domain-containing protein n=1 Tax=Peribacillus kribbensis TaxID=356658 RepID=UPI00040CBFD9|nr:DUF421 domain-containing protein [Peribacillus kribbensis]